MSDKVWTHFFEILECWYFECDTFEKYVVNTFEYMYSIEEKKNFVFGFVRIFFNMDFFF